LDGLAPAPIQPSSQIARAAIARSSALRQASLRSEAQRACAVIVIALLMMVLVIAAGSQAIRQDVRVAGVAGILVLIGVQLCALAFVARSRRLNADVPMWFIVATLFAEGLIPTSLILWQVLAKAFPPYTSLGSPPVLAYGLMICLTTLRLRPWLCLLAGLICAAGYAGIFLYIRFGLGIERPPTGLPYAAYVNGPLIIFFSGLGAAWVTRQIRTHLEAALGEAESRHQIARLQQDLDVARTIQQALLPRAAPNIKGYEVAGWNRSADQTGGDYYDWQALPDGSWIVTLADVSGHGVGPAMVTAACRAYMRAGSHYHPDLGSLTSRINQLLADDLPEGRFVTMAAVRIDPNGGPPQLLSAGHGPIVLFVRATGQTRDVEAQDLPLAIAPGVTFGPAIPVPLEPGDMLALVTDGFVEWSRPRSVTDDRRDDFGLDRLRASLKRHAHLAPEAIIQAVAAEVSAFAQGEPQQDDLTMVIIRRTA
jgi:serine phosphatase RsbU (regulator of sigma subunit)